MNRMVEWEGKYIRVVRDGTWEFVERCGGVHAVVIVAEHEGEVVLIEQVRVPLGRRKCLELPAGLVGDEDPNATVEDTAIKELEEETGFTAERIEVIGEYFSSPGMVAEGFTLVRVPRFRPSSSASEPRARRSTSNCCCCSRPISLADAFHRRFPPLVEMVAPGSGGSR